MTWVYTVCKHCMCVCMVDRTQHGYAKNVSFACMYAWLLENMTWGCTACKLCMPVCMADRTLAKKSDIVVLTKQ